MPANGRWDLIRRLKVKRILGNVLFLTICKIGMVDKTTRLSGFGN